MKMLYIECFAAKISILIPFFQELLKWMVYLYKNDSYGETERIFFSPTDLLPRRL